MGIIAWFYDFFGRPQPTDNDHSRKRRADDIGGVPDNKLRRLEGTQRNGDAHISHHVVNRTKDRSNMFVSSQHRGKPTFISSWDQIGKENDFRSASLNNLKMEPTNNVDEVPEVQILEEHNFKSCKKGPRNSNPAYNVTCGNGLSGVGQYTSPQSSCDTEDVEFLKAVKPPQASSSSSSAKIAKERTSVSRGDHGHRSTPIQRRPFKTIDPSSSVRDAVTPILFSHRRSVVHSPEQSEVEVLPSPNMTNGVSPCHFRNLNSSLLSEASNIQRNSNTCTLSHMKKVRDEQVYGQLFQQIVGVERPIKMCRPKSPDVVEEMNTSMSSSIQKSSFRSSPLKSRVPQLSPTTPTRCRRINVPVEIQPTEPSTSASRQLLEDQDLQIIGQVQATSPVKPTDPDLLTEILQKYALKDKQLEQAKEMEKQCRLLSERNRQAEEQRKNQMENALIAEITSYLHIVEEIEEEEPPSLPVLTPDMESEIDRALGAHPDTVLANAFNLTIKGRDMRTLKPLAWLNDEVINFYMNLLIERGKLKDYPSVHAFNTFFFPKLSNSGYDSLKRWTKKVDIFSHDYILVPIHRGMHWCMAIIDMNEKVIRYYDSMDGRFPQCADALLTYLQKESMDKKKQPFDTSGWVKEHAEKIPQQNNGSDCGMFACMYAEYVSRNAPISFSQDDMPYFRRKVVYEILKAKLLT